MKASVRGVLVALHLAAITAGSLPVLVDERVLTPAAWNDPVARQEFHRWSETIGHFGIKRTEEEVGVMLWGVASTVLRTQRAAQRPFEVYYREAGTRQRWRMFPAAVEEMPRLRIDVERAGTWETLYRMGDPAHHWAGEHFDRDRVRAALNLYAWGLYPESYEQLVDWIAVQVPGDERVRVGFEQLPAIVPGAESASREVLGWPEAKLVRIRPR